jgi:hypothetical protein
VDPVPDPLLLRKSGSAGNRTKGDKLTGCIIYSLPLFIFISKYYEGDHINEYRKGGACNMHDKYEKCIQSFSRKKAEVKTPLRRPRCR